LDGCGRGRRSGAERSGAERSGVGEALNSARVAPEGGGPATVVATPRALDARSDHGAGRQWAGKALLACMRRALFGPCCGGCVCLICDFLIGARQPRRRGRLLGPPVSASSGLAVTGRVARAHIITHHTRKYSLDSRNSSSRKSRGSKHRPPLNHKKRTKRGRAKREPTHRESAPLSPCSLISDAAPLRPPSTSIGVRAPAARARGGDGSGASSPA
jgi:hypothetical protein